MEQLDLFATNLIKLMQGVWAGPVLSGLQRARLYQRIRANIAQASLKEAESYLWPVSLEADATEELSAATPFDTGESHPPPSDPQCQLFFASPMPSTDDTISDSGDYLPFPSSPQIVGGKFDNAYYRSIFAP